MPAPFTNTLSFLEAEERTRTRRFTVLMLLLVAAAGTWLVVSRTTVYVVSSEGSLLAAGTASPVQAPVAGVIRETHLELGATVAAGDVLVELDASAQELRKREELARIDGLQHAYDSLGVILQAERALAEADIRAGQTRVGSAAARARAAAEVAALTRQQSEAVKRLKEETLASDLDALKAAETFQRERTQLVLSRTETALAAADLERSRRQTSIRLLNLEWQAADLRANIAAARAVVAQVDWEIALRTLRAPVDGVVADVAPLPKGAALSPNQVVATIVPKAKMRWVAYFSPREAVGRVRPGQRARIRLDAFPWTAYGPVSAVVASVGSEPREQRVRVEFDVVDHASSLPLLNGMTGATDVEVEQLSPFRLILRLAGQLAQGDPPSPVRTPATTAPGPEASR